MSANPFAALCAEIVAETPLRAAITAAYRRPEPDCVQALIEGATLKPDQQKAGAKNRARTGRTPSPQDTVERRRGADSRIFALVARRALR